MFNQSQKILLALLLVQIALISWVYWPQTEDNSLGSSFFADSYLSQVERIEIENKTGERLSLVQDSELGNWTHAPSGYLLTAEVVETLLANLGGVTMDRLVTQTSASHSRLGVAESQFESKISLWADGVRQELLVGTAPNSRTIHVRLPNNDEVWLTDRLTQTDVDIDLRNWLNTLYYSVERKDVAGLIIDTGDERLEFFQIQPAGTDSDGNSTAPIWGLKDSPADANLDQAAFGTLLSRATSMRFTEPLGTEADPRYQLESPVAQITILLENGERNLTVGAFDPETNSYVVASDFNMIVRIASSSLQDLIEANREGLVSASSSEN